MFWKYLLTILAGYLLGNIQTSMLISRNIFKDDVRKHGSGNAGSTNMLRVYGKRAAVFTFAGDFMKGVAAVLVGQLIGGGESGVYSALCAFAAVVGHDYPALYGFRGGKGVATTLAIMWLYEPGFAAICTAIALMTVVLTGIVSLASLLGTTLFAIMVVAFRVQDSPVKCVLFLLLWALVVLRHSANIERLIAGKESRFFK
jgi:glycerol-3-phosphate acyltransferase PlsY